MTTKQEQARELFFQADLTQAQIACLLKVNAKTVYRWIKQGHWERIKKAALNAPAVITEKLYHHLNCMCADIEAREKSETYITLDESRTILNLATTIKRLGARPSLGDHCESITGFMDYVIRKDYDKGQIIAREIDEYLLREAELACWYDRNDIRYRANHLRPLREDMSDQFEDGSSLKDENPPIQNHPDPYEEDEIAAAMAQGEPLTKKEKREIGTRKSWQQTIADYQKNKANPAAFANSGAYSGHKLRQKIDINPDRDKLIAIPPPNTNKKSKPDAHAENRKDADGHGEANSLSLGEGRGEALSHNTSRSFGASRAEAIRDALKRLFPNSRWEAAGSFMLRDIATNIQRKITDDEWCQLLSKGYTNDELIRALG